MQKLEWYSEEEDVQMCFTKGKDMVSTYYTLFSFVANSVVGGSSIIVPYYRIRSSMNFVSVFYHCSVDNMPWWNPNGHFSVSELDEWFTCQGREGIFLLYVYVARLPAQVTMGMNVGRDS